VCRAGLLVLLIFWVSRRGDLPINTLGEGRTSGPAGRTCVVTTKAIWGSRTRWDVGQQLWTSFMGRAIEGGWSCVH